MESLENSPVVSDVLVRHVVQFARRDSEISESLSSPIDFLVDELPLNLIGVVCRPPDFVQYCGCGLRDGLGKVNAPSLLQNHAVDEMGNLVLGILTRSEELERLTSGGVIVSHDLESTTNINHMHGSGLLLPRVGTDEVSAPGNGVEESVLVTEHRGGPDDGGLGEDIAGLDLSLSLAVADQLCWNLDESYILTLVAKYFEGELTSAL